jgi:glycosyltransferase involved in cell wall biosynthesis
VTDQVHLPGFLPDPAKFMGLFDLFALSSDSEQMPLSVIEAMAAGLAVVTTDVGDIKDMVVAENRPYIVPASDEASFANRLEELIADPQTRDRLGRQNRDKALREYTAAKMAETNDALIKSVLASR